MRDIRSVFVEKPIKIRKNTVNRENWKNVTSAQRKVSSFISYESEASNHNIDSLFVQSGKNSEIDMKEQEKVIMGRIKE